MIKRLKENHPTSIKLEKLFSLAEELGISITCNRLGQYIVCDNEWPGVDLYIKDIDNNDSVTILPPDFEYKVVYHDSAI